MKRAELEHVLRAAGSIADDDELIVIGSQSVLGQFPDPPESLTVSMEVDIYPKNRPERWDLIDGSIGEGSPFHEAFGYYAQGVGEETARLPDGWKKRLVPLRTEATGGIVGWCLEVHDLVASKLAAGREKDLAFAREALAHGMLEERVLLDRARAMPVDVRAVVEARIRSLLAGRPREPT